MQAASDITISNAADSDITTSTPFKDATNNGGTSNLRVVTLVGALGSSDVVVTTTSTGGAPFNGRLEVKDSIAWNTNRTLTLFADSNLVVGATITNPGAGGSLVLNSVGSTSFDADVTLGGAPANLTVNSAGISQTVGRKLLVDGLADLSGGAGAVSLLSDNRFGSLKLTGGAVTVKEADSTLLTGVGATTLTLTTAGTLTDAANTTINVTGLANLNAGANAITLGDNAGDTTNFGSLDLTGSAVTISEDSGSELAGVGATSLSLTSNGAITDSGNISVSGLATFNAGANAITLGEGLGETTNFGTLNLNGGAISISEDSASDLVGTNTAASLALSTSGALSDATAASVNITGLGNFSGTSISLGGGTFNTGSLTFNSAGAVNIDENSSMLIAGVNTGGTTNLTASGGISDLGATSVNVGVLTLNGTSIDLGSGTFNATTLNFNSTGAVNIAEDSNMDLVGTLTAGSASLSSTGALTDATATSVSITGLGSFSGTSISLGGGLFNTGSLNFNSTGAVSVQEDSSTVLSGPNTGSSLLLNSAGAITDVGGTSLTITNGVNITSGAGTSVILDDTAFNVGGNTTLTAGAGQDIIINNAANSFTGTVTFVASSGTLANVNVFDTTAFDLQALTVTSILTAISGGALTDSGNLSVAGLATLGGSSITIGGAGETTNLGSLTVNSSGTVTIQEDSSMLLAGINTGGTTTLSSTAGVSDTGATSVNVGALTVSGTSINLGGGIFNATTLTFNSAGAVTIAEDSNMDLVGVNTGVTTILSSTGALSDSAATSVNVGALTVSGTSINLGGGIFNATTLNFNSAGAVTIAEDSSMDLVGVNTAGSATLSSTAGLSDAGATSVNITGLGNFSGTSINLGGGLFNTGSLTFNSTGAVTIQEDSSTLLTGVSTASSVTLSSTAAISNDATANLTVTNHASFAGASISLGSVGGDSMHFGTLSFNSAGAVIIQEDSSTELTGTSTAGSLALTSAGSLVDSGDLSVTGLASFSGTSIMIGGAGQTTNFGSLTVNSAGNVGIQEDSDTQFVGSNSANILTLTSSGISTFTAGSTLNAVTLDILTQTVVLTGNNLVDTIKVQLTNGTTLSLDGSDTIGTLVSNGGTIAGTGTLTATGGASLNGGNVSGHLLGDTTSTGDVLVSGTIGGGFLHVDGGVLTLTGSSTNTPVEIALNAALLDSNGGLSSSAVVTNAGLLTVNSADTISTYTQNGTGTLAGSASLTATGGATLNGGTIFGHLLGNTTSTADVLVSGSIGGGSLSVIGGTLTLTGTSTNTPVGISSGAALLDSNGGLDASAVVTNAGLLTVNSADTISTYTQNGTGTLAGSASLTTTGGATLNGGTVSGHLLGNTTSTANVLVSGSIGGGSLSVNGGLLTLTGTSTNTPVDISAGAALLDSNGGFDASAVVTNAGLLTVNSADTISIYTQNGTGTLAGSTSLTATGGAALNGGTVSGHLLGNTTSTADVLVSGSIGGGSLSVTGGLLTLTGTSTNTPVSISSGAALLDSNGGLAANATFTNAGLLTVDAADSVLTYTQNGAGVLAGSSALTATGGATLTGGTVLGQLLGDTTSTGVVLVSGSVGGGSLSVTGGTLTLTGTSTNNPVEISTGATLLDLNGGLSSTANLTNAGLLAINSAETVLTYTQNGGGILAGTSALTATSGATLNGGEIQSELLGDVISNGNVLVSGSVGGGFLRVNGGTLTLTGTANSNTLINPAGTLKGTGLVNGNLKNLGTLAVGSKGNALDISGDLVTKGTISLTLDDSGTFERIKAASANLGGELVVKNTGSGLTFGEMAKIIDADTYSNGVDSFTTTGFGNGVLFNDRTGTLIGLNGGTTSSSGNYANLNSNQTSIYLALFDDSVQPGIQNVTREKNPSGVGYVFNFTSGASNGDAQLVTALYQSTFTNPGTIEADTMNSLSPEVHRGMADYTKQALRNHVREAVDAAPISRKGKTQVFATVHTVSDGVDSTGTNAGYDLEMNGATAGMRYDVNGNFKFGGLLGIDDGTINGALIDTDAQGFVLGTFSSYQFNDPYKAMLTGTAAFGSYSYDAVRRSFGGDATADSIGSDAVELSLSVSSVVYEKQGFRLAPSGALRYMGGSVDSFVEKGPGVRLAVDSQDIDTVLFDVGFDLSYQLMEHLSLAGRVGYVDTLSNSEESLSATFAATGPAGVPFAVSAPGIHHQAVTIGVGLFYDATENTRIGVTYRGEFRTESQSSQTFGLGASYGF